MEDRVLFARITLVLLALVDPAIAVGQPVRVEAQPGAILPGAARSARITISLEEPADEVVAWASAGRLEGLSRLSPLKYEATFVAPEQTFPEMVMIAAVARRDEGSLHGLLSLPIWGRGWATVSTRPRTRTVFQIGGRTYGPVNADASGLARVQVEVAPAEQFATVGDRKVDLRLPRPHGTLIALDRVSVGPEGGRTTVRIFLFDALAHPRRAQVSLRASAGEVSELRELEPGAFEASWSLGDGRSGDVLLECFADGTLSATRELLRVRGPPASIEVLGGVHQAEPGEPLAIDVRVVARDQAGDPVWVEPSFSPEVGVVVGAARLGDETRARWELPANLGGRDSVDLEVAATVGEKRLGARWTVALDPPRPARLQIEVAEDPPSGGRRRGVQIRVTDRFENPVRGPSPLVTSQRGKLTTPRERSAGHYELEYLAPKVDHEQRDTLAVRVGALESTREIVLRPRLSRLSMAVRAGVTTNGRSVAAPCVGADVGVFAQPWQQRVGLVAAWSAFEASAGSAPGGISARAAARYASWTLSLAHDRPLSGGWRLRLGGGGGFATVAASMSIDAQPPIADSGLIPVVQAFGSASHKLGPGSAFAELSGGWWGDPSLAILADPLFALSASVGYRYEVF